MASGDGAGGALARAGVSLGIGIGLALAVGQARRRVRHAAEEQPDDAKSTVATGSSATGAARAQGVQRTPSAGTTSEAKKATAASVDGGSAVEASERVANGLRDQIDVAIATLNGVGDDDLDKAVHETRKAIKRARSTLRLLAWQLRDDVRTRCNATLRDAGRALSSTRDADVALATLEAVLGDTRKRVRASPGVVRLRASLLDERNAARDQLHRGGAREQTLSLLWRARSELAPVFSAIDRSPGLKGNPQRGKASGRAAPNGGVRRGLSEIYSRGRKAMREAERRGSARCLHEWRKRAKDLRYATEALAASERRAARLAKIARRADKLGELLGEEHDLALLEQRVRSEKRLFRKERGARRELRQAIARRREKLRARAFADGARLYGRSRKRFLRRVREEID